MNAKDAQDTECATVRLHAVYDQNANLSQAQRDELYQNQVQAIKDEYGDYKVHFEVSSGAGAVTYDKQGKVTVEGYESGATNLVATTGLTVAARSASSGSTGVVLFDMNRVNSDTGPHEIAHLLLGHGESWLQKIPTFFDPKKDAFLGLASSMAINTILEADVGSHRLVGPTRAPFDPNLISGQPRSAFQTGARRFSVSPDPQANRPTTK